MNAKKFIAVSVCCGVVRFATRKEAESYLHLVQPRYSADGFFEVPQSYGIEVLSLSAPDIRYNVRAELDRIMQLS